MAEKKTLTLTVKFFIDMADQVGSPKYLSPNDEMLFTLKRSLEENVLTNNPDIISFLISKTEYKEEYNI